VELRLRMPAVRIQFVWASENIYKRILRERVRFISGSEIRCESDPDPIIEYAQGRRRCVTACAVVLRRPRGRRTHGRERGGRPEPARRHRRTPGRVHQRRTGERDRRVPATR